MVYCCKGCHCASALTDPNVDSMISMMQKPRLVQASQCLSRPASPSCMQCTVRRGPQTSLLRLRHRADTIVTCGPSRPLLPSRRQATQTCVSASAGAAPMSTQSMDDGAAQRSPLMNDIFGGLTTAIVALPLALAFGVASGGFGRDSCPNECDFMSTALVSWGQASFRCSTIRPDRVQASVRSRGCMAAYSLASLRPSLAVRMKTCVHYVMVHDDWLCRAEEVYPALRFGFPEMRKDDFVTAGTPSQISGPTAPMTVTVAVSLAGSAPCLSTAKYATHGRGC